MVASSLTSTEQIKRVQDKEKLNTTYKDEIPASIGESLSASIEKATSEGGNRIIGIVSTNPGVLLGDTTGLDLATKFKPVALSGRVLVKVTNEGGEIKVGDPIALSSTPGRGMKATTTRAIVGTALEDFSGAEGKILVFVNLAAAKLDASISGGTIVDGVGESSFWSVEDVTGRIKFISAGVDLNDQEIVNVKAIRGSAAKWSIDEWGRMVVADLEVRGTAKIGSPDKRTGITLYDETTGAPYCLSVVSGAQKTTAGECGTPIVVSTPEPEAPAEPETPAPSEVPAEAPAVEVAPESTPEAPTEPTQTPETPVATTPEPEPTVVEAPAPEPTPELAPAEPTPAVADPAPVAVESQP
ncbi:MAG: hypothetical protein A2937_02405 [Candidatus Yonathbacteria bacterium RIFCSPLOWO2_01_FULL_47_33b]|uniref:Uncharacterized protein n=1 Tax=Candidatus Yonathbacteria bacterium RIFCSPLOWO2_01_FULL_47_33b TaxID=1802727 RepID=A0A1G2SF24_9BACT|nr:MAG: hypothetical protein A2937_02405 [Candidatus Yonathbacteria bacterium RIFCSPLOWO2_01_FULL_47_33b]